MADSPSGAMPPAHADQHKRFFRKLGLAEKGRGKLISQRNAIAVNHRHPLCALARLDFLSDAKKPFRSRSETVLQKPFVRVELLTLGQSRQECVPNNEPDSRFFFNPEVARACCLRENSPGNPCQQVPLRRIRKRPSRTLHIADVLLARVRELLPRFRQTDHCSFSSYIWFRNRLCRVKTEWHVSERNNEAHPLAMEPSRQYSRRASIMDKIH